MEKEKLCLRCMRKIGNNTVCPHCRDESNKSQDLPSLPLKAVVGGRYLIGKAINTNAAGMTYNAFDMQLKKPVTLHELFPGGVLVRGENNQCLVNVGKAADFVAAKESFLTLWRKLSGLKGYTALINVTNIFEDLGTVYAVSEFLGEGQSLREYLLSKSQGYISWEEARVLLMPVVSALGELHAAGIIHGAISPENLIIDSKGKVKISGFSVPEIRIKKGACEPELFAGYAAVEQYGLSNGFGPCTDIYGFAAVLYRTLIGSVPMSAAERLTNDKLMIPGKFAEQLPAYVINALVNALQILPEERTSSVELLRNELSASPAAAGSAAEAYSEIYRENRIGYNEEDIMDEYQPEEPEIPQAPPLKKSSIVALVLSIIFFIGIVVAVVIGFVFPKDKKENVGNTETYPAITQADTTEEQKLVSIKVPDFKGQVYEKIKNNEEYKAVLIFRTEYVDSVEERGTIISQSIAPGKPVDSIDPKIIIVKISNGLNVPKVVGHDLQDALQMLEDVGFKNISCEASDESSSEEESNKVYRITYKDEETGGWIDIPGDNRLSASDEIILYHYGEYVTEESEENNEGQGSDASQTDTPTDIDPSAENVDSIITE